MKIISKGGGIYTKVLDDNGNVIPNITKIEIHPFTAHDQVTATLTFANVELNVEAKPENIKVEEKEQDDDE